MSQAPLERYDFAASERVKRPLRKQLDIWSEKASEFFVQQWQTVSESEIKVAAKTVDAHSFVDIQESCFSFLASMRFQSSEKVRPLFFCTRSPHALGL